MTSRAIIDWMDLNDVDLNDEEEEEEEEDARQGRRRRYGDERRGGIDDEPDENETRHFKEERKEEEDGIVWVVFAIVLRRNGDEWHLRRIERLHNFGHARASVSDDGGSTSEIIRVSGGPAVGDIRSRCLRLSDESTQEAIAVKELLAHRLHPTDEELAKNEWYKIQEGDSPLWDGIDNAYATIIRRFLVHFHTEVTTNTNQERFAFVNGSIGNFFFAGSRMFFRSMEAAIFLHARVSKLPRETMVVPCIECEGDKRVTINAELTDGTILRGQNDISHPSVDKKSFTKQFDVDSAERFRACSPKNFGPISSKLASFQKSKGRSFGAGYRDLPTVTLASATPSPTATSRPPPS